MLVKAKYQLAYNNEGYDAQSKPFIMFDKDYPQYQNDVVVVKEGEHVFSKPSTKVRALNQFAINSESHEVGDVFDLANDDLEKCSSDVVVVEKKTEKPKTEKPKKEKKVEKVEEIQEPKEEDLKPMADNVEENDQENQDKLP